MGLLDGVKIPTNKPADATGGLLAGIKTPTAAATGSLTANIKKPAASASSPYIYIKTPEGATIGRSDQTDVSGKPFLGYRNPGDTATSTDKTRTATTFDPRIAQPLDLKTFLTARLASGDAAKLKKEMGGSYSDELDHKISLELSGSNDPANLMVQPGRLGGAASESDKVENSLARDVVQGKKSLFDAQTELAKQKGLPTPWVPPKAPIPGIDKPFTADEQEQYGTIQAPPGSKPGDTFTTNGRTYKVSAPLAQDVAKQLYEGMNPTVKPLSATLIKTTTDSSTPQVGSGETAGQEFKSVFTGAKSALKSGYDSAKTAYTEMAANPKQTLEITGKATKEFAQSTGESFFNFFNDLGTAILQPSTLLGAKAKYGAHLSHETESGYEGANLAGNIVGTTATFLLGGEALAPITKALEASSPLVRIAGKALLNTSLPALIQQVGPLKSGETQSSRFLAHLPGDLAFGATGIIPNRPLSAFATGLSQLGIGAAQGQNPGANVLNSVVLTIMGFAGPGYDSKTKMDIASLKEKADAISKMDLGKNPNPHDWLAKEMATEFLKAKPEDQMTFAKQAQALYNHVIEKYNNTPNKEGGFAKNPFAPESAAPESQGMTKEEVTREITDKIANQDKQIEAMKNDPDLKEQAADLTSKVYSDPIKKIYTPEEAKRLVNDLATDFDKITPGLGDKFRSEVPTDNLSETQLTTVAHAIVNQPEASFSETAKYKTLDEIPNKEGGFVKLPTFEGFKDLSTTVLEKLKGRAEVAKQFISDLANSPELKQAERNAIRTVLSQYSDDKPVPVQEFADQVKEQLLPLDREKVVTGARYENIALPADQRGPIDNYSEHIYTSPVETSAGDIHFGGSEVSLGEKTGKDTRNYFGHTRVEDLPDGTRRVIEVQSDLYQKGRLENETKSFDVNLTDAENRANQEKRGKEIAPLKQYNDPTAHFRMVREEIKQAAKDGKTNLQFPTGETAMKIEGLGNEAQFVTEKGIVKPQDLKPGLEVTFGNVIGTTGNQYIVTDVLGNGKFKAVPKSSVYDAGKTYSSDSKLPDGRGYTARNTEAFDISGKVDTQNPIYKFYEKDLGRYLKRFGAQTITDKQGVTWNQIPISKDMASQPVLAHKYHTLSSGPKASKAEVKQLIEKALPGADIKVIFDKDLLSNAGALGQYKTYQDVLTGEMRQVIKLYEKGGKAAVRVAYHEAYHALENAMPKALLAELNKETLAEMTAKDKQYYANQGYKTEDEQASEYRADEWGKEQADKAGYKSRIQKILDRINEFVTKIIKAAKDVFKQIKATPNKEGGFAKNPFGNEIPAEERPLKNELAEVQKVFDEFRGMEKGAIIDNPTGTIESSIPISNKIKEITKINGDTAFFQRAPLKHLSEKGDEGELLLKNVPSILKSPDEIYKSGSSDRFIISKNIQVEDRPKQAVILEVTKDKNGLVITAFKTNPQYLKNFDLLWRTPPDASGSLPISGSREGASSGRGDFSTITTDQNVQEQNSAPGRAPTSIVRPPLEGESPAARLSDFQNRNSNLDTQGTLPKTTDNVNSYSSALEDNVAQLDTARKNLEETILQNPAKNLVKFADRNGDLPEVLGGDTTKFGKMGDDIAHELGYPDSETARLMYQAYKVQKKRLEILKGDIAKIKELMAQSKLEDKDAKSLKFLLNKNAKLTEKDYAKIASAKKPAKVVEKLNARRKIQDGHLNRVLEALRATQPAVSAYTPETRLDQIQKALPLTAEEFELMNKDVPWNKIVLDTSTNVKQKVGILDYLRTPDRVLKKIGLEQTAADLRAAYENYLRELPLHIEVITDWSNRVSKEGNKRIFDYLDGQMNRDRHAGKKVDPLDPEEMKVAGEIKVYLKEWAERLGLPDDNQITHYITHIFGIGENEKEFDEDVAKLIKDQVPGSVYDPFLEKRLGAKGYIQDTWKALDAYVKRAVRKENMDPVLEKLKDASKRLEESQLHYVMSLASRINLRPTEVDTLIDNTIKQIAGYRFGQRPIAVLTRGARRIVYRSMLGLNIGSAIKNLTQGTNTFAKLGTRYTMLGYIKLLTKGLGNKELEEQGILSQDIIQDRVLSSTKKLLEKTDKALFFMFETTEKINRGAAYWGAKAKAINAGKSEVEAIAYAKKIVRDTQFMFGSIDTPVGLNSDLAKLFTQFMSFGVKQTEFAAEMVKNKEWAGIMRYMLASTLLVYLLGKIFNLKAQDFVPGYNVIAKFGVPPTLALPWEITKAVMNAPDTFGNQRDLGQKASDVARAIPLPASVQAQKTIGGISTYNNPKKKVIHSPYSFTKAAVLGQQNLPTQPNASKANAILDKYGLSKKTTTKAQDILKKYGVK